MKTLLQTGRAFLRSTFRPKYHGQFQPYTHTMPDRYPWLFQFARDQLGPSPRLLSFGCSSGDEVLALRKYMPRAAIKGTDINPANIRQCRLRARAIGGLTFSVQAGTEAEADGSFDAIFCLSVLVHGDLIGVGEPAPRSEPLMYFADFERTVVDFSRCLKSGGLLILHTTNFRFCDTSAFPAFDVVLRAQPDQMAVDPQYDRHNRLIDALRYSAVGFRKKHRELG